MLSVITALEFFQHYFAKTGHRNTSCDPHLHQAIEQPMLRTPRVASAAGRLRPNALAEHGSTCQEAQGHTPRKLTWTASAKIRGLELRRAILDLFQLYPLFS